MIKERNVALCIVLSLVTCGIYGIYWFVCLTNDTNTVTGEEGTSGGLAFLFSIITCGIYSFFWAYKQGEKLDKAKVERGMQSGSNAILYLLLSIFGLSIVAWALMQSELNKMATPIE